MITVFLGLANQHVPILYYCPIEFIKTKIIFLNSSGGSNGQPLVRKPVLDIKKKKLKNTKKNKAAKMEPSRVEETTVLEGGADREELGKRIEEDGSAPAPQLLVSPGGRTTENPGKILTLLDIDETDF